MGIPYHVKCTQMALYHSMFRGNVMYFLLQYHVATSGLVPIVAIFYMNIMQLRPSEINTL